jgi:hypothetical protein
MYIITDTNVWFVNNTRVTSYFTVCQFILKELLFCIFFTYRQYTYIIWKYQIYLYELKKSGRKTSLC